MPVSAARVAGRHLRTRTAADETFEVVEAMIDAWGEEFLDSLARFRITEDNVDDALTGHLDPDEVNAVFDPTGKTAGIMVGEAIGLLPSGFYTHT